MRLAITILIALPVLGCGTLGAEGGQPGDNPVGGTGLFRVLERTETGRGSPVGRVLENFDGYTEAPSLVGDHLFYAAAPLLEMGPEPSPDVVEGELDLALYGMRSIFRTGSDDPLSFKAGELVLEPSESWEGDELFDPWAVPLTNGSVRLYYTGVGGIGAAEADSATGSFSRVLDGPLVENARRPAVLADGDGFLVYFERDGEIQVASSTDGLTLESPQVAIAPVDGETRIGAPCVLRVETPSGRTVVRLYFESTLDDGSTTLTLAASEQGFEFDRFEREVIDGDLFPRFPLAQVIDDRTTLLYLTVSFLDDDIERRALVAAVTPASFSFTEPTDESE